MRRKYEDYSFNPQGLDDELQMEELESLKKMFMDNLSESIKRFENDPMNTETAVHVTGSTGQGLSDNWEKPRTIVVTASDVKDFVTSITMAKAVCKRKFGYTENYKKMISNVPAIRHGREYEPVAIEQFESYYGNVVKTGLHISKANPNFGTY